MTWYETFEKWWEDHCVDITTGYTLDYNKGTLQLIWREAWTAAQKEYLKGSLKSCEAEGTRQCGDEQIKDILVRLEKLEWSSNMHGIQLDWPGARQ